MSAREASVVAVGLIALVASACDAVLSIHELDATGPVDATSSDADAITSREAGDAPGPSDAQAADAPALSFGPSACAACAAANCGKEAADCGADPTICVPYESCLASCDGDPACRSRCTIDNPVPASGSAVVSALSTCLASKCATDCRLTCGAFAGYLSEPPAAAGCQSCLNTHACADSLGCGTSAECDAYWRCYAACPTPDCKFTCALQHDAGVTLFRPLQADYSGVCAAPCAFGNYWACVGKTSWPSATTATVELTVPVIHFVGGATAPGETVSICVSCPCGPPLQPLLAPQGTTDDAGIVTLEVQQRVTSSNIGLNGCVQVTSPDGGTVPYFGYWGYPLSAAVADPALGPGSYGANIAAQSAQVFTPAELGGATGYIGVTQDPARGSIGAAVFDCLANPTPNARVAINSSDPLVSMYYGPGGVGATTSIGYGFFYNVQPGNYQVVALPGPLDGGVSSVENINVAAYTTTAVGMFPTPPGPSFLSH